MSVLAALFGLLTAAAVWIVIDPIQTRAISNIFGEELQEQLEQRARESLLRFDSFLQSYTSTTQLLANHRRMADYLDPVVWFPSDVDPPVIYQQTPPIWLPDKAIRQLPVLPSHVLLVDVVGRIREQYQLGESGLPTDTALEVKQVFSDTEHHAFLTKLDGRLYVLVSERVEDASRYLMGSLVLLVPIDARFLNASQQRANTSQTTVAILDGENQVILSSSKSEQLLEGESIEQVRKEYVVTAQSFFEYDDTAANLLFATLIPRDMVNATMKRIVAVERRHRLTGAAIVGVLFVLLFMFISGRISRLLRRIAHFSSKALEIEQAQPRKGGNQLLVMEEWIRAFSQAVMKARDEMRAHYTAEIQEREALKSAVLDTSLDPIVTIDQKGRVVDFNPTAEHTFGFSALEATGKQLDNLVFAPGSRDAFNALLKQSFFESDLEAASVMRTLSAVSKEGKELPVEVAIKPVMLEQRALFTVYIRDISERKRQAQEIVSLAAFPSESPMPILRINRPGVVIYANNASKPLLDYWGCRRLQTIPIYWKRLVEEALIRGVAMEEEVQTVDGIYSLLLAPVKNLEYVNVYGRDVTAIKLAEAEARHRQNELIHVSRLSTMGEMATGIAHELNQPLSAIVNFANGCARRIRMGIGEKDDLLGVMRQIADQANRAGEIIKRLRGMVTRQQPVRQDSDLNALVKDACALLAHDRQKLGIALEFKLAKNLQQVRVDPVQIEQVILNLLRNALDALQHQDHSKRELLISTGIGSDGNVYVAIQDNGPGISGTDLKHLFDPFFSTKETGMGMGLSISQTIISEHGGKIRVDSFPGKGTVFIVELPAEQAQLESIAS